MSRVADVAAEVAELHKMMEERMNTFDSQLKTAAKPADLSTLSTDFNLFRQFAWKALSVVRSQLAALAEVVDAQEMRSRSKVLLIHGVTEEKSEVASQRVAELVRNKMGLEDFSSDSIKVCHRLGANPRVPTRPRALLVRFTQLSGRAAVWKAKTTLKGSGITVSEFLTRVRHDIFLAARKHFGMARSWTQDGRIIVQLQDGSRHKVVTAAALKALTDKHPAVAGADDVGGDKVKPRSSDRVNKGKSSK